MTSRSSAPAGSPRSTRATCSGSAGLQGRASGHAAQLEAVFDALAAGVEPPVTIADARATLEFVTAVYASAFTRAPVRRGEIGPDSPFYRRMDGTGAPWA